MSKKQEKRPNGMGSVYREGEKWVASVTIPKGFPKAGKRMRRVRDTEHKANLALLEMQREFAAIQSGEGPHTVSELCDMYLKHIKPRVKSTSYIIYESRIEKRIKPFIGGLRASSLTAASILDWIDEMSTAPSRNRRKDWAMSNGTAIMTFTVLRSVFRLAVKRRLLIKNVVDEVDPPRPAISGRAKVRAFSAEDRIRILAYADEMPEFQLPFYMGLQTGMRIGEIFGLQWSDVNIDSESPTVSIKRTVSFRDGVAIFTTPKSMRSNRTIQIPRDIVALLKRQREHHKSIGAFFSESHATIHDGIVPKSPTRFYAHWKRTLRLARVEYKKFHCCRHTFVSAALSAGAPVKSVAEYVGDTVQMILGTYTHMIPGESGVIASVVEGMYSDLRPSAAEVKKRDRENPILKLRASGSATTLLSNWEKEELLRRERIADLERNKPNFKYEMRRLGPNWIAIHGDEVTQGGTWKEAQDAMDEVLEIIERTKIEGRSPLFTKTNEGEVE